MRPQFISEEDFKAMQQRMGRGGVVGHVGELSSKQKPLGNTGTNPGRYVVSATKNTGNTDPGSNPALSPIRYRSKWEPIFAAKCDMEVKAGMLLQWWYEPASLRLEDPQPGKRRKRHTPDFWLWLPNKTLKIVAVKGYHKNIRESLTLIRWAAQRFPFAEWWVTWLRKGTWEEERV